MLARGSLGNPWLFDELLGGRTENPSADEILDELDWMMDAAAEHFGPERAGALDAQGYPWYIERLGAGRQPAGEPAGNRFVRRRTRGPERVAAVATLRRRPRLSAGISLLHHPVRTPHAQGRHPHPGRS